MKLIRDLATLTEDVRRGAVTIGNFDGVHRGHAQLLARLIDRARQVGGPAVVFTFDPHPVRLLRPAEAPPPLTWTDRKARLLSELGVDAVVAYRTDEALLSLSPREFFDEVLLRRLDARAVVEGPNFFFGHDRAGNTETLQAFCDAAGLGLEIVEPVKLDGDWVSSSRIRELISRGQIDQACQLLTQPYRIRGMVTHGAGRGGKIGCPTANVGAIDTLLPGPGVYAGRAHAAQGSYAAAINVGPNPTFDEQTLKVEVHLLDVDLDLYGQPLEVDFVRRLRDIQRFSGLAELQAQLTRDVAAARAAMAP